MFWELYVFLLLAKYQETLDLGMFSFLILFPYYRKSLSPCFGDNTTDVKTNKNFSFPIPFPLKCLCETHDQGS